MIFTRLIHVTMASCQVRWGLAIGWGSQGCLGHISIIQESSLSSCAWQLAEFKASVLRAAAASLPLHSLGWSRYWDCRRERQIPPPDSRRGKDVLLEQKGMPGAKRLQPLVQSATGNRAHTPCKGADRYIWIQSSLKLLYEKRHLKYVLLS